MLPFALLATFIVAPPARSTTVGDSSRAEPVILDVRIGSVASVTLQAMRVGDTALLPVARVFALAELSPPHDPPEYLAANTLAGMLHTSINIDWDELTALITDDGTLPVSRRAARERRRAQFSAINSTAPAGMDTSRHQPMLPRDLIVDYDIGAFNSLDAIGTTVRIGAGSDILGGGLDIDWARAGARFSQSTVTWQRSWPWQPAFRDVRVGTIPLANIGMAATGLFISSVPPVRGDSVEPVRVARSPGPGWEVEAYRDDVLIYAGLTDSAGGYTINVPAARGLNRVTVAEFGPHGEQRSVYRYVSLEDPMLPTRTGEYDFAIGRCATTLCNYATQLDARYALFSSITVGVGLAGLVTRHGHELRSSALLATHVRDDINASASFSHRGSIIRLHYAPGAMFDLVATYRDRTAQPALNEKFTHWPSAFVSAIWRHGPAAAVSASLDFAGRAMNDERRLRVGASFVLGHVYVRPFASVIRGAAGSPIEYGYGTYVETSAPALLPPGSRIRSRIGDGLSGDPFIAVAMPAARLGQIELGAEWLNGVRQPRLTASVNVLTHAMRYDARSVTDGAGVSTTHSLGGSLAIRTSSQSGTRAATLAPAQLRGRATIVGTVFLDADNDGVPGASEQPLPGVSLSAGGSVTVESDSAGNFRIYDLTPFAPVTLVPDPLTLPYPALEARPMIVVPLPNGITRVNLAVHATRQASL